jgi:hypothetical protein
MDVWASLSGAASQGTAVMAYTRTMPRVTVVNRKMSLGLSSSIRTDPQPEREPLVFVTVPSSIGGPVPSGEGCILCMQFRRGAWSQHCSAEGSSPAVQRALPPSASALAYCRFSIPDLQSQANPGVLLHAGLDVNSQRVFGEVVARLLVSPSSNTLGKSSQAVICATETNSAFLHILDLNAGHDQR